MSAKLKIPESGKLSIYFSPEEWSFIEENYDAINDSGEQIPWGKFFFKSLLAGVSVRKPDSNPKDAQIISDLQTDLNEAMELNKQLSATIEEMKQNNLSDVSGMSALIDELKANISENVKESQAREAMIELQKKSIHDLKDDILKVKSENGIPEGGCIVILTPAEAKVVDHICQEETKRTGKEVVPGTLLKNIFFFILVNGPHDVFSAPVSVDKIRQIYSAFAEKKS